jgi:hypothetical protein
MDKELIMFDSYTDDQASEEEPYIGTYVNEDYEDWSGATEGDR